MYFDIKKYCNVSQWCTGRPSYLLIYHIPEVPQDVTLSTKMLENLCTNNDICFLWWHIQFTSCGRKHTWMNNESLGILLEIFKEFGLRVRSYSDVRLRWELKGYCAQWQLYGGIAQLIFVKICRGLKKEKSLSIWGVNFSQTFKKIINY